MSCVLRAGGREFDVDLVLELSKRNEDREDILTSNVFSFFKYADRRVFLFNLLKTTTQQPAVFVFAGTDKRTQSQIFFIQFQTPQGLRLVGVSHN